MRMVQKLVKVFDGKANVSRHCVCCVFILVGTRWRELEPIPKPRLCHHA
jgi:hypothetical protein